MQVIDQPILNACVQTDWFARDGVGLLGLSRLRSRFS